MGGPNKRTLNDMVRDQLVIDRIESWGEWDFLARDVPVEKEGFEVFYDVITLDMENRRIQADIIGYNNAVERNIQHAVEALENDYGYLVPHLSSEDVFESDFPPPEVGGAVYWTETDSWKLDTSEFEALSDNLFGYDILSRDYGRIDPETIK